jgi:hypothetical protein
MQEKRVAEFTGALWTSKKLSFHLMESSMVQDKKDRSEWKYGKLYGDNV